MKSRFVPSKEKLAAAIGVSLPTIAKYTVRGMDVLTDEGYDVEAARRWAAKHGGKHGGPRNLKLAELRDRKLRAEIALLKEQERAKRLKIDVLSGKRIDVETFRQFAAGCLLRIKYRLESIPDEMQVLFPSDYRPIFHNDATSFVHDLLAEMAGMRFEGDDGPV